VQVPKSLLAAVMPRGRATVDGTLIGSHLAPTFQCCWDIPQDAISGGATFRREAAQLNLHTPSVDLDVHLDTKFPPFEVRSACWVALRARWATLRAHWVTLRARWVALRAR
jgi:hypothetical protein